MEVWALLRVTVEEILIPWLGGIVGRWWPLICPPLSSPPPCGHWLGHDSGCLVGMEKGEADRPRCASRSEGQQEEVSVCLRAPMSPLWVFSEITWNPPEMPSLPDTGAKCRCSIWSVHKGQCIEALASNEAEVDVDGSWRLCPHQWIGPSMAS